MIITLNLIDIVTNLFLSVALALQIYFLHNYKIVTKKLRLILAY